MGTERVGRMVTKGYNVGRMITKSYNVGRTFPSCGFRKYTGQAKSTGAVRQVRAGGWWRDQTVSSMALLVWIFFWGTFWWVACVLLERVRVGECRSSNRSAQMRRTFV